METGLLTCTVEPRCGEVLGAMEVALCVRVSHCVTVGEKTKTFIESLGPARLPCQVVGGFCCIRPLNSEVPLYYIVTSICTYISYVKLLCY